ncbi:MAG: PQQ-dependent sugar dehydrogenase [Saprospiraceae bacterium]
MKRLSYFLILLFLTAMTACQNNKPEEANDIPPAAGTSIILPGGFHATVVTDSLGGRARHIAVNANGDIYVQMSRLHNGKGLAALRDTTGDGIADQVEYFGGHTGTGMAISGGYLYCSSDVAVYQYDLPKDGALLPDEGSKVEIAGGFPEQREHAAKSLAFDEAGNMYVNVGAPMNACQEENRVAGSPGQDPCPLLELQAGIWKFDANKPGQQHGVDDVHYASGIRNAVALDWNQTANSLFAVQHGRDQLSQFWPDLFTGKENAELPAEEFFQINEGDFFGWPYCFFNHLEGKKLLNPEYGGDGKTVGRCASAKKPILGFPGHLAPNDLLFYEGNSFPEKYRHSAFIAFHGSWNRAPLEQKGYFVAFVPFADGKVAGDWEIFANGFAGMKHVASPGDAKHRPMGLATGPDGALYVADSVKGKIWKITYGG